MPEKWHLCSLHYYNQFADDFISGTVTADIADTRSRFLACLPEHALILDFGCGSGRDTKAFLEAGYQVEATDGSEEICAMASKYTGIHVRNALFNELEETDRYDGIWACASILHLPAQDLKDVLSRIGKALKPGGVLYASFKYGEYEGMRDGRYFKAFTEETLKTFWETVTYMQLFDIWISGDVRSERKGQKWTNLLARRI